ncbi:MAG: hypothetical protein ACOY5C_08155 [Pseudomonadota bacterium]
MASNVRWLGLATSLLAAGAAAQEPDPRFSIELEGGGVWQSRNKVQIPNDATGTRFDLAELTGSGPYAAGRLTFTYAFRPRHELRLVYAPFSLEETGTLPQPVAFAGGSFAPGQPTTASYRFDSYRLTYRYLFHDGPDWRWQVGFTAKIRDAEVELRQGANVARDSNVGFVPLLHLHGERRLAERWRLILDFDGLAAPQGRALDFAAKAGYALTPQWTLAAGYRVLEGGVDNDSVYNFAWLNYAVLSAGYRF